MDTKEKLIEIIRSNYQEEQTGIDLHDKLVALLKAKYTGKKLTSRIEEQFKKAYSEYAQYTVRFSKDVNVNFGQVYFSIWKDNYDKRIRLFIGYTSEVDTYNPELFEDRDACHGKAAKERNRKRLALLNSDSAMSAIAENIENYRHLKLALESAREAIHAGLADSFYSAKELMGDK